MMLTGALTAMGIALSIFDVSPLPPESRLVQHPNHDPTNTFLSQTSPLVTAIPTKPVLQAPLNGYSVFDVTWQIVVDPKNAPGVTTNFTGTVQEVMAQAVALNPNFMSDYDLDPSKLTPPGAGDPGVVDSDLEQDAEHLATVSENNGTLSALMGRYTIKDHVCFPKKWTACRVDTIDDGIYYLEKKAQGIPGEGPGPASCGRVSCSYNAAIWWCNDVSNSPAVFLSFWFVLS